MVIVSRVALGEKEVQVSTAFVRGESRPTSTCDGVMAGLYPISFLLLNTLSADLVPESPSDDAPEDTTVIATRSDVSLLEPRKHGQRDQLPILYR